MNESTPDNRTPDPVGRRGPRYGQRRDRHTEPTTGPAPRKTVLIERRQMSTLTGQCGQPHGSGPEVRLVSAGQRLCRQSLYVG